MADRITVTGIEAYGHHGVLDHERKFGQSFRIDVTCWLDVSEAAERDDLGQTVNYAELAQLAHDTVAGEPKQLIETVAVAIADEAMQTYPILHAVEVTIHKPNAPIPLLFDNVAVTARRSRKTQRLRERLEAED